uniref:Rac GTPase-activating protein 1 n=1 Tax=Cacopsylla melanoneura TaxID=428564 RepID=A0A8D8M545_9HEMI
MTSKMGYVHTFDDLMGRVNFMIKHSSCTEEFIAYVKYVESTLTENKTTRERLEELELKLLQSQQECETKDKQLSCLKFQVNQSKLEKATVEKERNELRKKLKQVTELLLDDTRNSIVEETKARISRITSNIDLNTPIVYHTNQSIFSELSFSSENTDYISDELLSESSFHNRKRKQGSATKDKNSPMRKPILKSRRVDLLSSASSEEEFHSLGETPGRRGKTTQRVYFSTDSINKRPHTWGKYKCVIPHKCQVCTKLMSFPSDTSKCETCKVIAHAACHARVLLPCVPAPQTPTHLKKTISGNISAYTPFLPPMIPGLVIHCINVVENTGLGQEHIYKYEGHPEQIKELLKELTSDKKFKLDSLLQKASIHSICSALKEFLLCLDEKLVPSSTWRWFAESLEEEDERDMQSHLYAGIAELPQPNRDTLAYIMLHLKRVAESPTTKMTKQSLSEVFGPITIGTDNSENISTSVKAVKVFENLLNIAADYWSQYIVMPSSNSGPATPTMQNLRNTPTSDMALVQTINRRGVNTPYRAGVNTPYRTITRSEQKKRIFTKPIFQ